MITLQQRNDAHEELLARLDESHELSVYEAIERLVQSAESVGIDENALVRMLDQGSTLEDLFELVESKFESLQIAA